MAIGQRLGQTQRQGQGQGQRQAQSLVMTPQLTQSIKLLAMPQQELEAFVAEEAATNPLLTLRPPSFSGGTFATGTAQIEDVWDRMARPRTLADSLCEQIAISPAPEDIANAARLVAFDLTADGRVGDLGGLASRFGVGQGLLRAGLDLVRSLDPAGIGAADLADCLALQLSARDRLDPAMAAIVANLPLVATGDRARLRDVSGLDEADLADALRELRSLDPRPGRRFETGVAPIAPPDILMQRDERRAWNLELNPQTLPRALVDNEYHSRALAGARCADDRAYIADAMQKAGWLVRALDQRARTILKVATALVTAQDAFFEHGARALAPLTMSAVAERIDMHESTVSRVVAHKTISGPSGMLPLRYFFSPVIHGVDGRAHSAVAVQERILSLVRTEGATILSDDAIVTRLQQDGVRIARRTVAKYRERLAIPSSVQRRRGIRVVPSTSQGRIAASARV